MAPAARARRPRRLLTLGLALGGGELAWLARLTPTSGYTAHLLPALLLLGIAMGNIIAPAMATATDGVQARDADVASATVTTMRQIGGSIAVALLSSFAAGATGHVGGAPETTRLAGAVAVHGKPSRSRSAPPSSPPAPWPSGR